MLFHNFKMISQSYIISHLNYCSSIYYGITKSKINYLDHIKNYSKNDICVLSEKTIIILPNV